MDAVERKAWTRTVAALLVLSLAGVAEAWEPEAVTSCGTTGKHLYLASDIDCTGTPLGGVGLSKGGTLDLRGFKISGSATNGVLCVGRCKIFGGGVIENSTHNGIEAWGSLRVSNVTIRGSRRRGIDGYRRVRIEDSVIVENLDDGVAAGRGLRVERSTISDNGCPAWNGPCDHDPPPFSDGIQTNHTAKVIDSTVSDNAFGGITARRVRTWNVVAVGNTFHPSCHVTVSCGDIESARRPRVRDTICDRSIDSDSTVMPPAIPWGVCRLY